MTSTTPLEMILAKHKAATFLFIQPGGNHGDLLIYLGMECLARRLGLRFRSITAREFLASQTFSEEIFYIHGGGGYNSWCSGSVLEILKHALHFDDQLVIQGPCTISDAEYIQEVMLPELKHSIPQKLIFFVREKTSLTLCEKPFEELGVSIMLDKDTAFWATKSDLEALAGSAERRYRLYALRDDNEAAGEMASDFGKGVILDPAYYCGSFEHWLKIHLFAKQIITSRTHSSILGALLEKPVILYPSKYHKNKSIWDYNLKHMGVVWGPDVQKPILVQEPALKWLPKRLTESYKVKQIIRWLQRVPLS